MVFWFSHKSFLSAWACEVYEEKAEYSPEVRNLSSMSSVSVFLNWHPWVGILWHYWIDVGCPLFQIDLLKSGPNITELTWSFFRNSKSMRVPFPARLKEFAIIILFSTTSVLGKERYRAGWILGLGVSWSWSARWLWLRIERSCTAPSWAGNSSNRFLGDFHKRSAVSMWVDGFCGSIFVHLWLKYY